MERAGIKVDWLLETTTGKRSCEEEDCSTSGSPGDCCFKLVINPTWVLLCIPSKKLALDSFFSCVDEK